MLLAGLSINLTSCATDFHRTPYMNYPKKIIYCVKDFVSIGIGPINADSICHNAYKKSKCDSTKGVKRP